MAPAKPLTSREFARLMRNLGVSPRDGPFALAVSGGADSMALALLFAGWGEAVYLTFDHGLRAESAAEAKQVGKWFRARGLSHVILKWEGKKPKSGIQAAARRARYEALANYCRSHGIRYLVLGHTRDDQAETFLIRLFRGSGVDGLAAMVAVSGAGEGGEGMVLLRPLLTVNRARLAVTLKKMSQPWIEDPSNLDPRFTRVKVRGLLQESNIEGLDVETLAKTAERMARARTALEDWTARALRGAADYHPEGYVRLRLAPFGKEPEEIGLRSLAKILMAVSGAPYPPRLDSLERLYRELTAAAPFKGATLMGAQAMPDPAGKDAVLLLREAAAIKDKIPIQPGAGVLWDGRYRVMIGKGGQGGEVGPLLEAGWRQVLKGHPDFKGHPLPHPVRLALPALWQGRKVLEVPHLNIPEKGGKLAVHPLFMKV